MKTFKKTLLGVAALAALALGGSALAGATSGGSNEKSDGPDQHLTGSAADRAGAAALAATGDGDIVSVERSDEGGAAVYEVKVSKDDGTVTEVQVDGNNHVVSQKADDDSSGARHGEPAGGDGDGENPND
jgi:uncharacterized membrane protein YkoI